jgi:hypothetical protein
MDVEDEQGEKLAKNHRRQSIDYLLCWYRTGLVLHRFLVRGQLKPTRLILTRPVFNSALVLRPLSGAVVVFVSTIAARRLSSFLQPFRESF